MTKRKNKVSKENKTTIYLVVRYGILLGLMFSVNLIYKIFTPLTLYPTYWLLSIFYKTKIWGNFILVNNHAIELIPPCIAGSAYLLLLILNILTPMNKKQRTYSLVFSFSSLLALNIIRIFILSLMFINDFKFFDFTHKMFWYLLSTIFVVAIWFASVKIYKIKSIPAYTDIKFLIKKRK